MNILHVACTNGDMCNGVQVVLPRHLAAQSRYADIACVNISNIELDCNCRQFRYDSNFSVAALEKPFDSPDIVIFHECYRIQYIKIARELRNLGVPYVIIPHGELSRQAQKKKYIKKKVANLLIFNDFIEHSVAIQLLSDGEMKNTRFGKRRFVGTNGINIPNKAKQSFSVAGKRLVYIGRLDVYHKGLDLMVEGVAGCADVFRKNGTVLDIYGPDILGRLEQLKTLIAENGVEDIIKLHGPVFGEEKETILLDADMFIQTSRFEGMPMGILEALAYGLPCLVTDGTTLADFVKDNAAGWTSACDADSIALTLKEALSSSERFSDISDGAREAVRRAFEWDGIARRTVEKYAQFAEGK